jgi:cytochrome c biogenesis protein CcmG/thiol:disulfide interchange protein DsbE
MTESNTNVEETKATGGIRWGWVVVFILMVALLVMVGIGLQRTMQGSIAADEKVPEYTLTTFDGDVYVSTDLRGQIVVINFWASWCKPCEQEAADLQRAWELYENRGDVMFLGVDYVDTEPEARAYLERFSITYPNGPDLGTRISQAFRTRGVPETYFIDRTGTLVYTKVGPFSSLSEITSIVNSMLEE